MDDQRVAQRPVLGLKNFRAGDRVERIRSQPVNRLGRQGHEPAAGKKTGRGGNPLSGGGDVRLDFHRGRRVQSTKQFQARFSRVPGTGVRQTWLGVHL